MHAPNPMLIQALLSTPHEPPRQLYHLNTIHPPTPPRSSEIALRMNRSVFFTDVSHREQQAEKIVATVI